MDSLVACRTPSLFHTRTFLAPVWGQMALTANSWPSPRHVTRGLRSSHPEAGCTSCVTSLHHSEDYFITRQPFKKNSGVSWSWTLTWIFLCAACFPSEPWNWVSFFPQPTVINFPEKHTHTEDHRHFTNIYTSHKSSHDPHWSEHSPFRATVPSPKSSWWIPTSVIGSKSLVIMMIVSWPVSTNNYWFIHLFIQNNLSNCRFRIIQLQSYE